LLISWNIEAKEELSYSFQNSMHSKSLSELKILRNHFFASKGYKFKDKDLNDHFSKFN